MTQQLFRLAWVNMLMWQRMSMRICFFDSSGLGDRMSCLKRDVSIQMGVESSLGVEVCVGLSGGWRYPNVE